MYRQTGFKLTEIYLSPFHKTPGLKFFCHCAQTYDPLFIEGTGSRWEDELYRVSVDRVETSGEATAPAPPRDGGGLATVMA